MSAVNLEPKEIKSVTGSIFLPCIFHEAMGPKAMISVLNFKPAFSLLSFTLIKTLFGFSSRSAVRVVSVAYPMLIFLLAILIPACD